MNARSTRVALLGVLLLAFALRVYLLDNQELRGDEAFGYFFSLRAPGDMVAATLELQEPHPVGSYWLQHGWLAAAGHSEFALRFLSVWFSVLAVALLARLARTLGLAPMTALLAALLVAVSPYAVWHAQDARMYSMSLALTVASSLCMAAWLARRRWPWAVGYVVVTLAALHVHYFAAFVIVAQYFFVMGQAILDRRYRWSLLPWLGMQAAVALLYVPWLAAAAATLAGYGGNGTSPGAWTALQQALSTFGVGDTFSGRPELFWTVLALLLVSAGLLRLYRAGGQSARAATFLLLYLGVPLAATWLSAQQRPIFDARYLIAAAPPFYLLAAAAVGETAAQGWNRRAPLQFTSVTLLVLMLMGAAIGLNRLYHDPAFSKTRGWRELAATLDAMAAGLPPEQVRIAQNFPDPTIWYYYRGPVAHVVLPPAPHDAAGATQTVDALATAGVRRVVLPVQPAPGWDDADIAHAALVDVFAPVLERTVGVWPVVVYAGAPRLTPEQPMDVRFVNGVTLRGAGDVPGTLTPGALLTPTLFWEIPADTATPESLKVSAQLLGPDGGLVAQDDRPLPLPVGASDSGVRLSLVLALPTELAPGDYQLLAVLYDAGAADNARFATEAGADTVTLGQFSVPLAATDRGAEGD